MKWIIFTGLYLFLLHIPVYGQYDENVLKAAYIERITRFVEWPAKASLPSKSQFTIGVFGDPDFLNTLITVFKEKPVKDHKVAVITIKTPEQINSCDLCFISDKAKPYINRFIATANSFGVLLFSQSDELGRSGVHFNFYLDDEKLKFEINEKSVNSAGFKVSYLLLQNSRIIQ